MVRRQEDIDARLRRPEQVAGIARPEAASVPRPSQSPPPLPSSSTPIPPPLPTVAPLAPETVSNESRLETTVGLNWINRVAIVTLIFGTAFFFKYAIDNNWIGPGVRIALGVMAAAVSMAFGDRMWRRSQQIFAQGLFGLGLALLYLSFYAAFQLYHLFPQSVSFVLMIAVSGLAFFLSVRYDSRAIALLGLLGGYLTPVMLSTGQNHPWVLFGYTFVLNSLG